MSYSIKDYKFEIDLIAGSHTYDRLYTCFDLAFNVAAELNNRHNYYPQNNWEYRAGAVTEPEDDCYFTELIKDTETETLIHLGNILIRYIDLLKRNGYDV